MATTFVSLPDDMFHLIFSLLSLLDLVHVGRVCTRFRTMQRIVCASRRSLSLALGDLSFMFIASSSFMPPFLDHYFNRNERKLVSPEHVIGPVTKLPKLSYESIRVFAELFSQLTTLDVSLDGKTYHDFSPLLALLSHTTDLAVLNLKLRLNDNQFRAYGYRLFELINQLSSLKQLSIELWEFDLPANVQLPILKNQLERFYLCSNQAYRSLQSIIQNDHDLEDHQYGNLIQIGIGSSFDGAELLNLNPQISTKLTHMFPHSIKRNSAPILLSDDRLVSLCDQLNSLRSLRLDISRISTNVLFDALAKLPNLFHLILDIQDLWHRIDLNAPPRPLASITPLSSIKALSFNVAPRCIRQCLWFGMPSIVDVLPNLEVVHFSTLIHEYVQDDFATLPEAEQLEHIHKALKSFEFRKLKRIYVEIDCKDYQNDLCLTKRYFNPKDL